LSERGEISSELKEPAQPIRKGRLLLGAPVAESSALYTEKLLSNSELDK